MCTGVCYWANIGRIVYAASEERLAELTGMGNEKNMTMAMPCRKVLEGSQKNIDIVGPVEGWEDRCGREQGILGDTAVAGANAASDGIACVHAKMHANIRCSACCKIPFTWAYPMPLDCALSVHALEAAVRHQSLSTRTFLGDLTPEWGAGASGKLITSRSSVTRAAPRDACAELRRLITTHRSKQLILVPAWTFRHLLLSTYYTSCHS